MEEYRLVDKAPAVQAGAEKRFVPKEQAGGRPGAHFCARQEGDGRKWAIGARRPGVPQRGRETKGHTAWGQSQTSRDLRLRQRDRGSCSCRREPTHPARTRLLCAVSGSPPRGAPTGRLLTVPVTP